MSQANTKWVFKVYWAWQEAAEAEWLSSMSAKGWHLRKTAPTLYQFEQGEPADYIYRFDFHVKPDAQLDDLFELTESAGWTHVCTMSGWRYFRADKDTATEIDFFTDSAGQVQKFGRLAGFLALATFPNMMIAILHLSGQIDASEAFGGLVPPLVFTLAIFSLFAMIQVLLKIARLRQLA
jgi:hypothetical protein